MTSAMNAAYPTELSVDNHFRKGTLTVVITCLKWTFNYDFWIRVTAHPEGNPNISKQLDINKHNPLLVFLSEALDVYENFSEPHLNSYQLHILGELLDSLF